ncbi:ABC transporter ATP-binding protein (plasmid) [Agrobacterium radiobacter]|uniref:Putative branched-chain amino acid transport ATP-binding protein n=1 Tax=Agrobacterium tumefaciens str. B6 TaxID=1183423 RepID=A0A822VCT8_AGRTU|nr:ABC transporter ATP-binding protein [Agrobacterium tumefaciens]MQB27877.1 ABC transporter ATP-binding protein [Agrobacterium tumefaciens]NTA08348.1 ABC transporter ATP-binding protein [Agrobacterium tumefaciens]NTB16170.1 ABC transporter ATP-binding protein [Agrobacterium tumefaciens]CVI25401.1 putative branched-chain amino acid transport ATP-binding protein [Agrobacterium tumefaciens str. B6]SPZ33109.1 ATP-binding ABC transporter component [Agrobacterium tumefaciens]
MPIIKLDTVSKRYGALQVTDKVSLSVDPGEAVGIIGPNGAGKTTLFNLIAGTTLPDSGTIHFDGSDVTRVPARSRCHRGIGRSFQIPHPFVGMTTYENVLVGATFGGRVTEAAGAAKAVEVLELTGLAKKANTLAGQLTLLERKRLEMARALASSPKLLLLDEIAGGLTEPECVELVAAIKSVRKEGVSIIWIEHVVHALLAVVDRIAVIDFGRKIADGDPAATMASPEVTAIYMGIEEEAVHA